MYALPPPDKLTSIVDTFERAAQEGRVVRVAYLPVLRDDNDNPRTFDDSFKKLWKRRPMLAARPNVRTVEVSEIDVTAGGHPIARVLSYDSPGDPPGTPRTLRLDRVTSLRITARRATLAGTPLDPHNRRGEVRRGERPGEQQP